MSSTVCDTCGSLYDPSASAASLTIRSILSSRVPDRDSDESAFTLAAAKTSLGELVPTSWRRNREWLFAGYPVKVLANTYAHKGYDETEQGGERFYIVVEWQKTPGQFWKATGHMDSYGEISGPYDITEVQGTTKTITVWEN